MESKLQKKCIDYLNQKDCYVVKVVKASKGGVPDIIVCYKGSFIAFEIKNPNGKGKLSELQKYNINKIIKAEGRAYVIEDFNELVRII